MQCKNAKRQSNSNSRKKINSTQEVTMAKVDKLEKQDQKNEKTVNKVKKSSYSKKKK